MKQVHGLIYNHAFLRTMLFITAFAPGHSDQIYQTIEVYCCESVEYPGGWYAAKLTCPPDQYGFFNVVISADNTDIEDVHRHHLDIAIDGKVLLTCHL